MLFNFAKGKILIPLSPSRQTDDVFQSPGSLCPAQIFVCASPATPATSCVSTAIVASGGFRAGRLGGAWENSRKTRVDFRHEICNSFRAWINTSRFFSLWQRFVPPQTPELGACSRHLRLHAIVRSVSSRHLRSHALNVCVCVRRGPALRCDT